MNVGKAITIMKKKTKDASSYIDGAVKCYTVYCDELLKLDKNIKENNEEKNIEKNVKSITETIKELEKCINNFDKVQKEINDNVIYVINIFIKSFFISNYSLK